MSGEGIGYGAGARLRGTSIADRLGADRSTALSFTKPPQPRRPRPENVTERLREIGDAAEAYLAKTGQSELSDGVLQILIARVYRESHGQARRSAEVLGQVATLKESVFDRDRAAIEAAAQPWLDQSIQANLRTLDAIEAGLLAPATLAQLHAALRNYSPDPATGVGPTETSGTAPSGEDLARREQIAQQAEADSGWLRLVHAQPARYDLIGAFERSPEEGARAIRAEIADARQALANFREEMRTEPDHIWRYSPVVMGAATQAGLDPKEAATRFLIEYGTLKTQAEDQVLQVAGTAVWLAGLAVVSGPAAPVLLALDTAVTGLKAYRGFERELENDAAVTAGALGKGVRFSDRASSYGPPLLDAAGTLLGTVNLSHSLLAAVEGLRSARASADVAEELARPSAVTGSRLDEAQPRATAEAPQLAAPTGAEPPAAGEALQPQVTSGAEPRATAETPEPASPAGAEPQAAAEAVQSAAPAGAAPKGDQSSPPPPPLAGEATKAKIAAEATGTEDRFGAPDPAAARPDVSAERPASPVSAGEAQTAEITRAERATTTEDRFGPAEPAAKHPQSAKPRTRRVKAKIAPVGERARLTFRRVYQDLEREGWPKGLGDAISPDLRKYPSVRIRPNGDVMGIHKDLRTYLNETGLTGPRRAGESSIESHHLLEDNMMEKFGIKRDEGLSVALEAGVPGYDHAYFSQEMSHFRQLEDIDEIYYAHRRMYELAGHSEWITDIQGFLRDQRPKIQSYYEEALRVAADAASFRQKFDRVMKFLEEL